MIPTSLKRLPRSAVSPGLDVDDGGKRIRRDRSVLLLAELPIFQRIRMKERGALITQVEDVAAAVAALAADDFDAAIVDMKAPGGGTALVKAVKAGIGSTNPLAQLVESEMAPLKGRELVAADREARRRHRLTPFFLVMEGERQYAIVVDPPEHSCFEDGNGLSLPDAVMCLDVGKLLLRGPALA